MSQPPGHPQRGEVIAGKYAVEDVLGAGGMGIVVAARHVALRQRVAVKFLLPEAARFPEASERFLREARAVVAIQSEHVARVLDVGTLDTGAPYMVMEFLAGTDLAKRLKQGGPLPVGDAVDFVLQACEAIAEAHSLGIVHRDLKPANLFLTTRAEGSPLVKVLDFGLSKMAAEDGAPEGSLTATGFVMGSPQYMSPEQIRSLKHVDWRTDIWALGVILYELMTGKRPFDGPSLTAVSASIVVDTPRSMRSLRGEIPEALEAAVMGCLEKDPGRRWRSLGELAQEIAPFAPQRSLTSVERILRLQPDSGTVPLNRAPEPSRPAAPVAAPVPVETFVSSSALITASGTTFASASDTTRPPSQPISIVGPDTPTAHVDPTTAPDSAWGQTRPIARRLPIAWIAAGLGAAAVAIGVLAWVLHARVSGGSAAATTATATIATVTITAAPQPPEQPPPVIATVVPAPAPSASTSALPPATKATGTASPVAPARVQAGPKLPKRENPFANPLDRSD
jgi:eukaryotic-like serine/threonine-protein kinase